MFGTEAPGPSSVGYGSDVSTQRRSKALWGQRGAAQARARRVENGVGQAAATGRIELSPAPAGEITPFPMRGCKRSEHVFAIHSVGLGADL
jgi:hypothetical protein